MMGTLTERDIIVDSTSGRMALARSIALLALLAMIFHEAESGQHWSAGAFAPIFGRRVLTGIARALGWSALLLGPMLTLGAISRERQRGTLEVLTLAGFGPMHLIGQKFLARFLTVAGLQWCTLPVTAFLHGFGGASWSEILALYVTAAGAAALGCAIGMLASVLTDEPALAATGSALFLGLSSVLPLAVQPGEFDDPLWFGPLVTLERVVAGDLLEASTGVGLPTWLASNLLVFGAALLVLLLAAGLLPRRPRAGWSLATLIARGLHRLDRFVPRFVPNSEEVLSGDEDDGEENPFAWREAYARSRLGLRGIAALAMLATVAMLIGCAFTGDRLREPDFHRMLALLLCGAALLAATLLSASSIASEKESKSLEILAMLEITPYRYVMGKFHALFRISVLLGLPALVHTTVFALAGVLSPLAPIAVLVCLPSAQGCAVAFGLYVSMRCRTVLRAMLLAVSAHVGIIAVQLPTQFFCFPMVVHPIWLVVGGLNAPTISLWRIQTLLVALSLPPLAYLIVRMNMAVADWLLWRVAERFHRSVAETLEGA